MIARRPAARTSPKNEASKRHDLEKRLAESLEREKATAEILRVISSSPTDVQPVFDAIVASAVRLCDATFGGVFRFHDGQLHVAALAHVSQEETDAYDSQYPRPPHRSFIMGRAFLDGRPVHVEDILTDPDYDPADASGAAACRGISDRGGSSHPEERGPHRSGRMRATRGEALHARADRAR